MVYRELLEYIGQAIASGADEQSIRGELARAGWHAADVDNAFKSCGRRTHATDVGGILLTATVVAMMITGIVYVAWSIYRFAVGIPDPF